MMGGRSGDFLINQNPQRGVVHQILAMSRLKRLYKEYVIEVTALPLRDGGFAAQISIMKDGRSYRDDTRFESGQVFASENEALEAGFVMGKQKIDAGFQGTPIVRNN